MKKPCLHNHNLFTPFMNKQKWYMLASSHSSWKKRALQAQQNILSWVYMDTTIHLILFTLVCLVSLHWHNKTSYLCYVFIGSSYDLERLTTSYVLYAFKGSCASWVYNSSTHLISITRWKAPLTTWLAPMRVQIRLPMGHKVYSYKKKRISHVFVEKWLDQGQKGVICL